MWIARCSQSRERFFRQTSCPNEAPHPALVLKSLGRLFAERTPRPKAEKDPRD
jgi:hypothetical protein